MNSEKVKEIKKALECCTNPVYCDKECPYHIYERHLECINELAKDSLTLINELESENERLIKIKAVTPSQVDSEVWKEFAKGYEKENKELKAKNELLKDRIAELEKEKKEQLKQFAERLKKKIYSLWRGRQLGELLCDIDETLKEFINKGESDK